MGTGAEWVACAGLTPYVHVELLFPDTDGSSYSITANTQKIHKVPSKQFARDEWEFLDLHLDDETVYRMQLWANQKHAQKCEFNWVGFTSAGVWPVSGGGKKYFCSEFVTEALQQGGLLPSANPAAMTPARLYAAVRPLPQVCVVCKTSNVHIFDAYTDNKQCASQSVWIGKRL